MKKALFLLLLIPFGCYNSKEQSVTNTKERLSLSFDPGLIDATKTVSQASVKDFYNSRRFQLLWRDSTQRLPMADSLIDFIAHANHVGLNPEDYHWKEIQQLLTDSLPIANSQLDVLLTDAYLTLYHHIKQGVLDPVTLTRVDLSGQVDAAAVASLGNLPGGSLKSTLRAIEPAAAQYQALKRALVSFQLLEKNDLRQSERVDNISLNMERWRWEAPWPDRYVVVNIPAFEMRVVEGDSVWLTSKVIVGKKQTPTPVMESVIRSFIIYPYWHVPESISTKEILPELQDDRSYLQRHNFDVLNKAGTVINADTIQWDFYSANYFPFILRQREGSENSMGIIKFNFANPYGVYLHDTNSKRFFRREKRDLSHGCVRVNDAVGFAHYLVHEDEIYVSPEDLDQYLSLQQRHEIKLLKPIPIKLRYFTCEVKEGVPFFYDDIYRKDSVMMQSMYGAPPIANGKQAL